MSNHLNDITKVYLESVLLEEKKKEKKLDPVGQEDGDIDNDDDEDESDEYLHAKRKAIGKAMGKEDKQKKEKVEEGKNIHGRIEVPGKEPIEKQVKKAVSNVDNDVDGDTDHNDKSAGDYGEFVPTPEGKKLTAGPAKSPKVKKESYYSWRDSLSEFVDNPRNPNNKPMTSDKSREKVVEKQVSNTIKINPVLKDVKEETLNEVTLIEEYVVEADDVDTIADFVFEELIEEGFDAIEVAAALIEAKVTFGHDTKEPVSKEGPKRVAKSMARIVRRKLKRKVGQKSAEMQVAAYNKGREIMRGAKDKARQAKQKLKRGIKNVALKVADKMSEETEDYVDFLISEGYDCSELTWDDMYEEYQSLDEGLRSAIRKVFSKKKEVPKPESRGEQLRKKYDIGPEKSDTSAKMKILQKTRARKEADQKQYGGSAYSKSVAKKSADTHDRYLKAGYSKYGADDSRGSGNKAARRARALKKEEIEQLAANLQEKAVSCWDTHRKVGMKMKRGKLVNDCRPKSESVEIGEDMSGTTATPQMTNAMKQRATLDMKISQLRKQSLQKDQSEKNSMKEAAEDRLRDTRQELGGVDGNVRYDKPARNIATGGDKKKSSGTSAFDFVKGELEKKYGKKAIISNKKG